jgi:hypothetical protein
MVTHAEPHSSCQVGLMISHKGLIRTFLSRTAVLAPLVRYLIYYNYLFFIAYTKVINIHSIDL